MTSSSTLPPSPVSHGQTYPNVTATSGGMLCAFPSTVQPPGPVSRVLRVAVGLWSSLAVDAWSESKGRVETLLKTIVARKRVAVGIALNNMPEVAACIMFLRGLFRVLV